MILSVVTLGFWMIGRLDRPVRVSGGGRLGILAGAAAEFACIAELTGCRPVGERFLWGIVGGCLLLACITDSLLCQVYNFTWWFALAAVSAIFWRRCAEAGESVFLYGEAFGGLLLFIGVQLLLGGRIYGKADGYAFCVCALAEAALGLTTAGSLAHMLLAYLLLFIVQAARGNINKRGNLHKPAPFLPYITLSFWMTVIAAKNFGCVFPSFLV